MFSWIFFRADDLGHAFRYIAGIFSASVFSAPDVKPDTILFILIFLFFLIEWFGRKQLYAIETTGQRWPLLLRWSFYAFLIFLIGMFMSTNESPFIYFKF